MPRRTDIASICILGSGPIVIGQACEFDYSGSQAAKVLRAEGYRVILINSNPATIMTDPGIADATYVEPLTPEFVQYVLEKERPDAILPTVGGQTALNLAKTLHSQGVFDELGITVLGVAPEVIDRAEDREQFAEIMDQIGVQQPKAGIARSVEDGFELIKKTGLPAILRPSFTLGGSGGAIAYNRTEFEQHLKWGLMQSPTSEVLIDESLIGWKEFELEVMRDRKDNVVIICGIENLDALGVHTGDSITVAPIQTLSDVEYQAMRDDALRIIRAIGVETGGCNIQFAVDPETGRRVVIEMNPRVSRSSALASKATGYPIAKISALLAVGYSLDEIKNDITEKSAAFEPVLDYAVVKWPRFAFEKFPGAKDHLTTQMKSVGEVMSIGRTFNEAFCKAANSLEISTSGLQPVQTVSPDLDPDRVLDLFASRLRNPTSVRPWYIFDALRSGVPPEQVAELTNFDPWFINNFVCIVENEKQLKLDWKANLVDAKRFGRSDQEIARIADVEETEILEERRSLGIERVFKQVDTCAAEFDAVTSYFYSSFERGQNEATPSDQKTVVILGGGPNRIGQGIEFDYCAVHGTMALREAGYRVVMINCNPETVSTDYDVSDRLYFEPLTAETVGAIIDHEKPVGVILQFGGQTPLKLADALQKQGTTILGTSPDMIDLTEDRERFGALIDRLGLAQPPAGIATDLDGALAVADRIGFPLLVRPSYVLGGRAMEIVYDRSELASKFDAALQASDNNPVLIDRFLNDAVEVDVDCLCDGKDAVIAGILEHIEEAGVHSGDSACVLPPFRLPESILRTIRQQTISIAKELGVVGLMNVQYAVQEHRVYILEVNPRASRTIPFISKAIGVPLAGYAARVMLGETLAELDFTREVIPPYYAVKESVFPFSKFKNVDTILGPEMRSTGEVMGIDADYYDAFMKAQIGAGNVVPLGGTAFVSVRNEDKYPVVPIAKGLQSLGFKVVSTRGTAAYLRQNDVDAQPINKVKEGQPHIVDAIINGEISFVVNTTVGAQSIEDSRSIRRETLDRRVPYFTTIAGAHAAVSAMLESDGSGYRVRSLQDLHKEI